MGGLIELPSGTVEKDEFLIDGLIREIKEETNLEIKSIDKFIGTFDYFSSSGKKTRQVNFVVSVTNNDIKLSDEHEAFYILSKDSEALRYSVFCTSADSPAYSSNADTAHTIRRPF